MLRLPVIGERVGPYLIAGLLGRGACGIVYKAIENDRSFALKLMNPAMAGSASAMARLKAEARALMGAPSHLCLSKFKDFFEHPGIGSWCLITDFVDGMTLDQFIEKKGPMTVTSAVELFSELAGGIAALHRAGFLHRDIRPENIMVSNPSRRLVLLDFGLATAVADRGAVCLEGEIWHFPAPCQAQGFPGDYRDDARLLAETARFATAGLLPEGFQRHIREIVEEEFEKGPWGRWILELEEVDLSMASSATLVRGSVPTVDLGNGIRMEMAIIPAGEFLMGAPIGEKARDDDEIQHAVRLTRPFLLGRAQVNQAQWRRVMGNNPSWFRGDNLPVEQVSWEDAQAFCKKLSGISGLACRLPTEAEWEYACRAGTSTVFHFGNMCDGTQANCRGDLPYGSLAAGPNLSTTTPAGRFPSNAWGLFDMHGNVGEWCADWYGPYSMARAEDPSGPLSGKHRIIRGGSWHFDPARCRSAYRNANFPAIRGNFNYGFRVAIEA